MRKRLIGGDCTGPAASTTGVDLWDISPWGGMRLKTAVTCSIMCVVIGGVPSGVIFLEWMVSFGISNFGMLSICLTVGILLY